jgi:uncharacterized protein YbbC (DUF1343 family)
MLNRRKFRAVETGVALIEAFRTASPDKFAWREPPYEYEHTIPPIDILYGSADLREGLEAGVSSAELAQSWAAETAEFGRLRDRFLLY